MKGEQSLIVDSKQIQVERQGNQAVTNAKTYIVCGKRFAHGKSGPTHKVFGVLVGAGLQECTHAVHVAASDGLDQRGFAVL
jgi:hypothetical protein